MNEIVRYRNKPKPAKADLYATRYEPGQPLDDLREVALMADSQAVLAEAPLPGETVLVVRYTNRHLDWPELEFQVVRPDCYLTCNTQYGSLNEDTERDLRQWYDRADGDG